MGTETYSLTDFETDMGKVQPRFADVWLVPGAIITLALLSGSPSFSSKRWSRWLRRIAFTGGVYLVYRNFATYKAAIQGIANLKPKEVASENS